MNKFILSLILFSTSAFAVDIPDSKLSPGDIRTSNKEDVCSTVNHKISTKEIRKGLSSSVKKQAFLNYRLSGNHTGYCKILQGCELDHLIPLELGGSNDIKNLWPEPYNGEWNAHMKDALENKLHYLVCKDVISLPEAQKLISSDWKSAWMKYMKNK